MRATHFLVSVLLAMMAFTAVVMATAEGELHAVTIEAPPMRDAAQVAQLADEIGLAEISSQADAEAEAEEADAAEESSDAAEAAADALLEISAPVATTDTNFVMDMEDNNQHVWVEAQSESGISTMKAPKAAKAGKAAKAPKAKSAPLSASAARLKKPRETLISANPTNAAELLVLSQPAKKGELPLANTFPKGFTPAAAPEPAAIVNKRMKIAQAHLKKLAHEEHVAEHKEYKHALHQHIFARQVEKARQSTKFERPLPPSAPRIPSASSNGAVMNGDRNHNILFPAATAKSDNKAPSQDHDFHHRGNGDVYYDHLNLVEHQSATHGEGEEQWSQEAEEAAYSEVDQQDAAAEAEARAPTLVKEPCADQCDGEGNWRTAACQDCIVRGMVNGWIVKSIKEQQKGYNYIHWARNKCVAYANELHLRKEDVKGAPFAHCFFQKTHETCNL